MRIAGVMITVLLLIQTGVAREDSGWTGPESSVYPLKIWIEKLSLELVFNRTEKAQKMLDLADERLKEAEEMENGSKAFEKAMEEYTDQLEELKDFIKSDTDNKTENIHVNIKQKIQNHTNRTGSFNSGRVKVLQKNIIEASSSAGESKIKVSVIDGNVSVDTDGGNATITRDENNVTVVSVTGNSRQKIVIRSSGNSSSSSSSSVVVNSGSIVVSANKSERD